MIIYMVHGCGAARNHGLIVTKRAIKIRNEASNEHLTKLAQWGDPAREQIPIACMFVRFVLFGCLLGHSSNPSGTSLT
jgi:hypothetical protein